MAIYQTEGPPHLGGYGFGGDWRSMCPPLWDRLIDEYAVRSVVDIGCGEGQCGLWFAEHGCRVLGIEGHPAAIAKSVLADIVQHDYTTGPAPLFADYDLGWCCEFVEHVEEAYIANILDTFCRCRVLAMTAAEPGQSGHHHVNCQPRAYWIERLRPTHTYLEATTIELAALVPNTFFARTGMLFVRRDDA